MWGDNMDEFLQEINATVYIKWILLQNGKDGLVIKADLHDNNTIIIENDVVTGKIIFYGNAIFEEELTDRQTNDKIFYLHFQLTYLNHAVELFKEMINCAKEVTNRPSVQVLLCCSGGLTTGFFAMKLNECAKLLDKDFKFEAVAFNKLIEAAENYDIILLAPQISYQHASLQEQLPNKIVLKIPTQVFAKYDVSKMIDLIDE